ncbi:hypothetical protein Bca4012_029585 [Brassica carinata]
MEPTNRSLTHLDTMPDDMLRLIISKVGAASSTDYCNAVLTCKSLNFGLDDPLIAKTLSIAPLVERPYLANGYEKMMESLLAANNLDAHYVKGMREYFYFDNHFLRLHHLHLASKGYEKMMMPSPSVNFRQDEGDGVPKSDYQNKSTHAYP